MKNHYIFIVFVSLASAFQSIAQPTDSVTIIDSRHYSWTFGETRNFRIFLPPHYFDNTKQKYPVIYFMHGWSQRYFGSSNPYADFDSGDDNKGDNIANFVLTHKVIVVKSDGYNRSAGENYYVRPYNIGPVETFRQFPLYYPELIDYIDTHYRTMADRNHRAISGLSMGGFMTFWIGGKYPHLFSAAGNFCGSPEFVVGPEEFPVEYRHLDMYNNYGGMKLRLHYGDKDFIRGYHQDLNRFWPQLMDNYESKIYDAAHSTCGMADMFNFLMTTFENPPAKPQQWDHIDVYPKFSIWDYTINSDRVVPGFTILGNVDKRGFKCSVREFLPDGGLLPLVNLSITSPPLYEKNQLYLINDIDLRTLKTSQQAILSDQAGRLTVTINGSSHQIGINKKADKPNISIAGVEITNMNWAVPGNDVKLTIRLLNKGMSTARSIRASLSATRSSAKITQRESGFGNIAVNEIKPSGSSFSFLVKTDSIEIEKLKLTIQDDNRNEWIEFFEIPVRKNLHGINNFVIADGKIFTVAKGGIDSATIFLGTGNGDGVANPGESVVLLVNDQGKYWRTHLFSSDRYINPFGVNTRMSDYWGNFDYVGGSAKYSVPLISSGCPDGHEIDFFAEYWLPQNPLHIIKQGVLKITVKGKDSTAPKIGWVIIPGDNILQVKIFDGSGIQYVNAKLFPKDEPASSFQVVLKDDGKNSDRAESDNVFSKKITSQKFGFYKVIIEAADSFGNKLVEEVPGEFILH